MDALDYTVLPRKVLPVKLPDGTALSLKSPKKSLFSRLSELKERIGQSDAAEVYDQLLDAAAEILSNNTDRREFTRAEVDDKLDISDLVYLIRSYAIFAGEITSNPN